MAVLFDEVGIPVKVHIDKIGPEGFDLDEVVTRAWLEQALGKRSPFHAAQDGHLWAHLDRVDDAVHVRGRTQLDLDAPCSRCLKPVQLALRSAIEVTLFPRGHEPAAAPSGELAEEDLGVSTYADGEIDLAAVVHDEVFLGLPMNPLCREDCAGLCASCGADLNDGPCACAANTDIRWQALRHIKVDKVSH